MVTFSAIDQRRWWLVLTALFASLVGVQSTATESTPNDVIHDADLGFTLTVPEGFRLEAEGAKNPDVVYAFVEANPENAAAAATIRVRKLTGVIYQGLEPDLPEGFSGEVSDVSWGAFELALLEMERMVDDKQVLSYLVQVPLEKQAIQISINGSPKERSRLRMLVDEVLGGLKGESNWSVELASALANRTPTNQPAPANNPNVAPNSVFTRPILIAMAIIVFLAAMIGLWFVSNHAPRGTTLGIAIAVWVVGASLGNSGLESSFVKGTLILIGIAGIILGVIDLFSKRRRPREEPTFVMPLD